MEEDVMGQQWVSVVEAAAAMKVHTRTIERHIKSGKLQSRRGDDGQVQVSVELPDEPDPAADALSVVAGQAENQVQLALGATRHWFARPKKMPDSPGRMPTRRGRKPTSPDAVPEPRGRWLR